MTENDLSIGGSGWENRSLCIGNSVTIFIDQGDGNRSGCSAKTRCKTTQIRISTVNFRIDCPYGCKVPVYIGNLLL